MRASIFPLIFVVVLAAILSQVLHLPFLPLVVLLAFLLAVGSLLLAIAKGEHQPPNPKE